MKIDIYMSELCGSYHDLLEALDRALKELGAAVDIEYHTIYYDDAISRGIAGSPSVWIEGRDAFPSKGSPGIA